MRKKRAKKRSFLLKNDLFFDFFPTFSNFFAIFHPILTLTCVFD